MKKLLTMLLVMLISAAAFMSCSQPQPEADSEGFTTMFYMSMADLNVVEDLNEIMGYNNTLTEKTALYFVLGGGVSDPEKFEELTGSTPAKNDPFEKDKYGNFAYPALALCLAESGFDPNGPNPFATARVSNQYQYWTYMLDSTTGKPAFKLIDEVKLMSDGPVLEDFIDRVYKATKDKKTKYILVMWDHGGGAVNGMIQDLSGSTWPIMSIQAFSDALNNSSLIKDGKKFEAIVLDACLMQTIEDLNAMKGFTKCAVASENVGFANKFGFSQVFHYLDTNPKADYRSVGTVFVESAALKADSHNIWYYTWSAFDLTDSTKIARMNNAYNNFIKAAAASTEGGYEKLNTAAENSIAYYAHSDREDNYDILSVAYRFYGGEDSTDYKALRDAINANLIYEKHGIYVNYGNDNQEPGSTGLAFFFSPDLGKKVGDEKGKLYSEKSFTNYCNRVKEYFSEDVSDFYVAYREATK